MARLRGRALRGERCLTSVPFGHWQTTTFTAGLRVDGLIAPFILDGPMDGVAFLTYVRRVLVPALKPGDIVIMDNLSAPKVTGVCEATSIKVVAAFFGSEGIEDAFDGSPELFKRACGCLSKYRLHLGESLFDWIKIGTVRRKVNETAASRFDGSGCVQIFSHFRFG